MNAINAPKMEIISCLVMGSNAYYYLVPLAGHPAVSRLWIVRPSKIKQGEIPDSEYVLVSSRSTFWRLIQMLWTSLRLGRRTEVKAFSSINPFPYGLIQLPAAILYNKPLHFGFVGSDWYRHAMGRLGWLLRPFIMRADFFTATGARMRQQMIDYGIEEQRIAILPHAIDVGKYTVNDPIRAKYTCVYVGQLIPRKQVDVILRAFAGVAATNKQARLCVVGDGSEKEKLRDLAAELDIANLVDFVGFQEDVSPYLSTSKILVMASEMEGLPFAMIEAMCSGLVPVSTRVGTIEDLIHDGENGLLYNQADVTELSRIINMLDEDHEQYLRLRAEALKVRDIYAFESATTVWDVWFEAINNNSS